MTIPNDRPRGMMVALWIGSQPSVMSATRACPASWKAVTRMVSGEIIALLRSEYRCQRERERVSMSLSEKVRVS